MESKEILDVIAISKTFHALPSDVIGIDMEDKYTRYCFNEACTYLYNMMQPDKDGHRNEPRFKEDKKSKTNNPGLDLFLK